MHASKRCARTKVLMAAGGSDPDAWVLADPGVAADPEVFRAAVKHLYMLSRIVLGILAGSCAGP